MFDYNLSNTYTYFCLGNSKNVEHNLSNMVCLSKSGNFVVSTLLIEKVLLLKNITHFVTSIFA